MGDRHILARMPEPPPEPPAPEPVVDLDALDEQLRLEGPAILFPPRLARSLRLEGAVAVRDALALPGGALLVVVESGDEVVATAVVPGHGGVRRALEGDGAFAGVARVLEAGVPVGRFEPRVFGSLPAPGAERAIDVDQSNDSMVVGDDLVVKIYARTSPGPQPGLDLPAHLAAVGFDRTPTPYGALVWIDAVDRPVLLATVSGYLPHAEDGWDWYVRDLLRWIDGEADDATVLEPAGAIGGLVAELHRALATPSRVVPHPVATVGRDAAARWRARAEATLDEALEVAVDATRPRLRELATRARDAFASFDTVDATPVMRIHGDLHVGQVLRWAGGYAVSDFDGNPLAPPAVRNAPDAPARDVASMVRAIDHVGRVVQRRRPGRETDVEGWILEARARFLAAYREGLATDGHLFDERLLFPFEVAQECHEHVYAARYVPRWAYVPDLALPVLLEAGP